ncbi:hypothetical protein LCGC14_1892770 [marine sediment metagenome]|uniref:Fido domain-containing protein n=1 Tax=marine sediment metagenome TaxID=412755 RepID=A0A0F9ICS8_9ZZZZ
MTPMFDHLRKTPWEPTFDWVETALAAAHQINKWHEDYPRRVPATQAALASEAELPFPISSHLLLRLHTEVFGDQLFAGNWRGVWVRVGLHVPPGPKLIPGLMEELERAYAQHPLTLDSLEAWYTDFQTIHPYQDGNGRVGGIVVAAYAHALEPERGWLAPNQ